MDKPKTLTSAMASSLRACLKTRFGVPPLGGAAQKPPKGGTPNLLQRVSMVFFKQALLSSTVVSGHSFGRIPSHGQLEE
jgi:hypothetical protein